MATLYVTEQGALVERDYGRLVVSKEDAILLAVPLDRVTQLVLVGRVGVTTPALHALLRQGAGVLLLERTGRVLGRVAPPTCGRRLVRAAQYQRAEDKAFCLSIARAMARGKLHNQRVLAMRLIRQQTGEAGSIPLDLLQRIEDAEAQVSDARDLAGVRGIEGSGTRAYFAILRSALRPCLAFGERTRRPPRDPVNALLSFGYTLLAQACVTACESVGLDPFEGLYHCERQGRPALALDLMEEFRSVIVDSVTLNLVTRRMVDARHFEPGPQGGIYLNETGMRIFLRRYSARLQVAVQAPDVERSLTYQKLLELQARRLRKVVEGAQEQYEPWRTR